MVQPQLEHGGFLIPNAGDVSNPKMAEPDRVDFNTIGNDRWGVIEGCGITVSGSTASTLGGTAVVNGILVTVHNGSAPLGIGPADRFDLVVTDENGSLQTVPGTPSDDPVFPQPADNQTVLAAVFCPAGSSGLSDNVIDKRNWLADALLTKLASTKPLIQNRNGGGDEYRVNGDGHTTWTADTELYRIGEQRLKVIRHLDVDGDLDVGEDITAHGGVHADGEVTGINLRNGDTLPGTGNPGDLFQLDSASPPGGRLYLWTKGKWEEMATISGAVPVGAVIQSMQAPAYMTPLGWVALDGQDISIEQYPSLFDIPALAQFKTSDTSLKMPDATKRVLLTDWSGAGHERGSATALIEQRHLPPHDHSASSGLAGEHDHSISMTAEGYHSHSVYGGEHAHDVADYQHGHAGGNWFGQNVPVIAAVWGGRNKLDALFNDKSHTHNVEPVDWGIMPAFSNVYVTAGRSAHGHWISAEGSHGHWATASRAAGHVHPLTVASVGQGVPLPIDPPYLTVFTYVRS